jgi:hypothetical protein
MTSEKMSQGYEKLLAFLLQFHSVLNTAWPKPDAPEMANASIFIGTNLFKALEDGVCQIQDALHSFPDPKLRNEATPFWNAFSGLFFELGAQGRGKQNEGTDYAFNLLYLASGVLYHRVAEFSPKLPTLDARLMGVEKLGDLLRLCNWQKNEQTTKSVFDSLVAEMTTCASDLKESE